VPQFDVYRNANTETGERFPFLVDVQAELFEDLGTRAVVPLSRAVALTQFPMTYLTPIITFDRAAYVLLTPQLAGISRAALGPHAGTVADQERTIAAALEFLLRGF
jgi:toxin CcdB